MKQARTRDNHAKGNFTAWDLGLSVCWKIKAPVWCFKRYVVNGERWK